MGILKKIGIVSSNGKTSKIFEELFGSQTFFDIKDSRSSEYIKIYWNKYKELGDSHSSMNGNTFELIISTLLIRENILLVYLQAKVTFVPNVVYDCLVYSAEIGPICLSLKTSLRERYKQADLESVALKYVHRKTKGYLFTLDENEYKGVEDKICTNQVVLGLDDCIYCFSDDFNTLIAKRKNYNITKAKQFNVIDSNQIITSEKIKGYVNGK